MSRSTVQRVAVRSVPRRRARCFSLAEADRSLVLVRRIVEEAASAHARLGELQETLEAAETTCQRALARAAHAGMLRAAETIRACAGELRDVGVELADGAQGRVDFPAMSGGREVRLCWRLGEPRVAGWHELGQSCAGRQPVGSL